MLVLSLILMNVLTIINIYGWNYLMLMVTLIIGCIRCSVTGLSCVCTRSMCRCRWGRGSGRGTGLCRGIGGGLAIVRVVCVRLGLGFCGFGDLAHSYTQAAHTDTPDIHS